MNKSTFSLALISSITILFSGCRSDLKNTPSDITNDSSDKKNHHHTITNTPTPNNTATFSEEQNAKESIMSLVGEYFEVPDPEDQNATLEQTFLIELFARPGTSETKIKVITPSHANPLDSEKNFKNHIEAAQSIFRVHSNYFTELLPELKMIGYGGKFMDKIQRIDVLYVSKKASFNEELYAMMLFSFLQDLNNHKERFSPYFAKFPVTAEEYELRIMLPEYQTLSPAEDPQLAFMFNIGDTIFLCHRETISKRLKIYKKMEFSDVIDAVNQKIKRLEDERKAS